MEKGYTIKLKCDCVCVCLHVHMWSICLSLCEYMCDSECMPFNVCVFMCVYVCVCVCMCVCVGLREQIGAYSLSFGSGGWQWLYVFQQTLQFVSYTLL